MKRNHFIKVTAMSVVAAGFPFTYGCTGNSSKNIVAHPEFLSKLLDEKTLSETGQVYLKKFPGENSEKKLSDLLTGNDSKQQDAETIHSILDKKTHDDFETGNTVIVNGWILSLTEARQCALFSLTQN